MGQKTAKTVEDVLYWIETTPHHYAATDDEEGFFILKGHGGNKLRIPNDLQRQTHDLVCSSPDQFDTRMFRANAEGLKIIEAMKEKKTNG